MNRKALVLALAACALAALVFLAWFSLPAAGEGQVLVLRHAAHAGPLRVFAPPWAARAVVPARGSVPLELTADLGEGSSWPLRAEAEVGIDPARLGQDGREALLRGGAAPLVRDRAPAALAEALRRIDRRDLLARPAALAGPLRAALGATLPAGIELRDLTVALVAPPEQARAAALSSARAAATPPVARVLYVGLDGADWEIVDQMVARGELPTFARLQREGARAALLAYDPMMSPLLWTTALTGRTPDEHGIADFTVLRGEGEAETQVPITSRFRKTPAIWEILATLGQPTAFVNHWGTEPAEQVPGILVSDLGVQMIGKGQVLRAGTAWPREAVDRLRPRLYSTSNVPAELVREYLPSMSDAELATAREFTVDSEKRKQWEKENPEGRRTPPDAFIVSAATASANLERLTTEFLARPELGIVSVYFENIDLIGHNFQHLAPPPHPLAVPAESARYAAVVENCYRQQDRMLGRLVAAAGPGTVVVVHSDHGFRWGARRPPDLAPYTKGQPVEWHRLQGVFVAAGGPVRRGVRIPDVTLYDVAPTLLALRGAPPADNMPGRVRDDLFELAAAARLPRARVPSWDPLVPPRAYENQSAEDLEAARAEALEHLKGLGYVGGEEQDTRAPATVKRARAEGEGGTGAGGADAERPGATYWRNLATWFMNNNRTEDAERALLSANEVKPLPKTYQLLAESRALRGDTPGALEMLEEGIKRFPGQMEADAALWMVELHLQKNDVAGAERVFASQRTFAEKDAAVAATIEGRLAEARGDASAARAAYRRALEADPRTSRALERLIVLSAPAERAGLETYLVRGLEQDQRIDLYWELLGLLRAERGEHAGAAEAFHRAGELRPAKEEVRFNEAIAWSRAGRPDRARAAYEELARLGTSRAAAWVNLGTLRAQAGDWRGALAAWERAQALGSDSPQLQAGIAEARRRAR